MLGMLFVLCAETMFFAGLISAYVVNRGGTPVWPPFDQPRLPVVITAFNTAGLLLSAFMMLLFSGKFSAATGTAKKPGTFLMFTILLGASFLIIQGSEWIKLLGYGLTTTSSLYGAFFYLIIGAHALHVVAGLLMLIWLFFKIKTADEADSRNYITVCSMYWYFVVAVWPVLYVLVYLS